ncbi:hypothetical protein KY333_04235 [Candidatus Woesearchaeota archaeon]|nr:hypothetical protein [Candidatus Woesearchaeota archaeon]
MSKTIVTIFGAALALIGLGGIPIYAVEKNLILVGVFTGFLIAGIVVLGYASKS